MNQRKNKKGFTLVEMLVSVGIFSVIMTIAVGALLIVYDTYRKTRTLKNAMENVNIAMESITKRIRTGEEIRCLSGSNTCDEIWFLGKENIRYEYRYASARKSIEMRTCPNPGTYTQCPISTPFERITAPDVLINNMVFRTYGINNNVIQDSITITISGTANLPAKSQYDSNFRIQATVSKRLLDVF